MPELGQRQPQQGWRKGRAQQGGGEFDGNFGKLVLKPSRSLLACHREGLLFSRCRLAYSKHPG